MIGADVAEKLLSPQNPRRDADLAIIREHGCTFRVFPRWKSDGTLERLTDVEHRLGVTADPAIFTHVESIPPPVSSTVVRAALGI